jgi:hypothetical protein
MVPTCQHHLLRRNFAFFYSDGAVLKYTRCRFMCVHASEYEFPSRGSLFELCLADGAFTALVFATKSPFLPPRQSAIHSSSLYACCCSPTSGRAHPGSQPAAVGQPPLRPALPVVWVEAAGYHNLVAQWPATHQNQGNGKGAKLWPTCMSTTFDTLVFMLVVNNFTLYILLCNCYMFAQILLGFINNKFLNKNLYQ